jgi:hypothetical protein
MTAPSRYHQVLGQDRWQKAFARRESVEVVLEYVAKHWQDLQRHPPKDMMFSNKEPVITYFFGISLRRNALNHGITGQFTPEAPVADISIKMELEAKGRTDIAYFSNAQAPALDFVLEFKKLAAPKSGRESRSQYCDSGILRFVNAVYARETDFGFMIGLIERQADHAAIVNNLKRAMQNPSMKQLLRMIASPSGSTVVTDDLKFSTSEFETRHARDHVPREDVLLGHLMLVHTSGS